jgi:hypothetical protein
MGTNYEIWNEKFEFNYDSIPRKVDEVGPNKKSRKRRNKLNYMRKIPHAFAPTKITSIMSDYIDQNKVLDAREVIPPSLQKEFSSAVNFNKETINNVLNFA